MPSDPTALAAGRFGTFPVIRQWLKSALDRQFENNVDANLFRGVFESAEAALATAPTNRPIGYDNEPSAQMYLRRLWIDEHDYPAMFWLSRSFSEGMTRVADFGGSVGIKYFAFAKVMDYPRDLIWRVIDVPSVAERGREFARSRGAVSLEFASAPIAAEDVDVIYASGALQYMPLTLADMLAQYQRLPRRVVVNTTAIHQEQSFYTLNSIGTAFCAYRVQSREAFVESVKACGYKVRDEWKNTGKLMRIPFHPECSLGHYSGFCFDAKP